MNLEALTTALAERLRTHPTIQQVYDIPPAGEPEYPSFIVGFPAVTTYHVDYAHSITRITIELKVGLGRGDSEAAMRQFLALLSTDTPESIVALLEAKDADAPWLRLTVRTSDSPRDEGDGIITRLSLELDA